MMLPSQKQDLAGDAQHGQRSLGDFVCGFEMRSCCAANRPQIYCPLTPTSQRLGYRHAPPYLALRFLITSQYQSCWEPLPSPTVSWRKDSLLGLFILLPRQLARSADTYTPWSPSLGHPVHPLWTRVFSSLCIPGLYRVPPSPASAPHWFLITHSVLAAGIQHPAHR